MGGVTFTMYKRPSTSLYHVLRCNHRCLNILIKHILYIEKALHSERKCLKIAEDRNFLEFTERLLCYGKLNHPLSGIYAHGNRAY